MKRLTSIAAAVFTAAFLTAATNASAQDSNVNQRTYLTFSGPVQMPGVTLPAGKYVFRLADTALHNVMQVFDGDEKQIIGQWFFVPKNRTTEEASAANGKPVVTFSEMPEGMTPAVRYYFYPTDLIGKEFIYPKDQAVKIAAATHQPVLATDTDAAKGGEAHVFTVEPNGTEAEYNPNASNQAAAEASTQPAAPEQAAAAPAAPAPEPAPAVADNTRATDSNAARQTATGTSGQADQNPAPRKQASAQLPKTASPFQLIGLMGLISLAGAFGLKLARTTY
jgi:hypothetical protein